MWQKALTGREGRKRGHLMPRPCRRRWIQNVPPVAYYKPRGVPFRALAEVVLGLDEMEALRLADLEGLSQEEAGRQMGVSRATFGRIVETARRKTAQALVHGMALRIEGGRVTLNDTCMYLCGACGHRWPVPSGAARPAGCPACRSADIQGDAPVSPMPESGMPPGGGLGMGRGGGRGAGRGGRKKGCGRGRGGGGRGMGHGQGRGTS